MHLVKWEILTIPDLIAHLDRQERCNELPSIFQTPDNDQWEPQATHYDDVVAAMIHNSGGIIGCENAIN